MGAFSVAMLLEKRPVMGGIEVKSPPGIRPMVTGYTIG